MLRVVAPAALLGAVVATCAAQVEARGDNDAPEFEVAGDDIADLGPTVGDSDTDPVDTDLVDTDIVDTDLYDEWTASRMAGEVGGLHCDSASAAGLWLWSPLLLLLARRRA